MESEASQQLQSNSDLLTVPKVDTHLHNSAMMTAKQLSTYMHEIYDRDKDRILRTCDDGTSVTVGQEMEKAGFVKERTDLDRLSGNHKMFANFENFNKGFTPLGSRALKSLFLGTSTFDGEYLFDLTKRCAADARSDGDAFLEPRFSVYGNNATGWGELAKWVKRWNVIEDTGILMAIQLPRVYHVWKKFGMVSNFGEMLSNFFQPLFDAAAALAAHPACGENGNDVAWLLTRIRMMDSVDDESKEDAYDISNLPPPSEWDSAENPPCNYYQYYMHANIARLNAVAGTSIKLRPHAGEAGPTHHLAAAFLFCDGISHGINLRKEPVLEYLYYLAEVPVAVSPISNSVLFLKYRDNPFPSLFKRGLCVTLTTDDPLMFHTTPTPLLEEYATARHAFDLSSVDLCEIARSSCVAAFSPSEREDLHGKDDPHRTNVPVLRLDFRKKQLEREFEGLGGR
jgi:AMP deaminase